jgi:transposase
MLFMQEHMQHSCRQIFTGSEAAPQRHRGKVRISGISKRGDSYLRTLLINGARSLVRREHPEPWIAQLLQRRPFNVVVVAVAYKLARTAWAIVAHQREYDAQWKSKPPHTPAHANA